jgi:uncharacterized membrane protein HdeD (DUF308 family)
MGTPQQAGTEISGSDVLLAARQGARSTFVWGMVIVSLGVFAVMAPLFSGIATSVLVGMLLLTGGIVQGIFAFQAPSFGKGVLRFLFGGLAVVAGGIMMAQPGRGVGALTMVLATYFLASGILDAVLAFKLKPAEGWGWTLFSGIVSIALAAFIIGQWPLSGVWAVGTYVGVGLLMHGWMLMALGSTTRDALSYGQDVRVESLERHVRAGLASLQETQLALVANTAMILALDNELRKKVSAGDVDPAIKELNTKLGEARVEAERAARATTEAWDQAQTEANKTFDSLQKSAASVIGQLQKDLGIR